MPHLRGGSRISPRQDILQGWTHENLPGKANHDLGNESNQSNKVTNT